MLIDVFPFFNEFDILEIRLNELKGVVDKFVICESDLTFTGEPKELNFPKVQHLYKDYPIEYVVYKGVPNCSGQNAWINEKAQRNEGIKGLCGCSDDDMIIISDVDEFVSPMVLRYIKGHKFQFDGIYALEMRMCYYNINTVWGYRWYHPKIGTYGNIKKHKLDDIRLSGQQVIKDAGVHLTYTGNADIIKHKIHSFSHQEFNTPEYNELEVIKKRIENNEDLYGRTINGEKSMTVYSLDQIPYYVPNYILQNKDRFSYMIRGNNVQ